MFFNYVIVALILIKKMNFQNVERPRIVLINMVRERCFHLRVQQVAFCYQTFFFQIIELEAALYRNWNTL